jgi:hypothetical protein
MGLGDIALAAALFLPFILALALALVPDLLPLDHQSFRAEHTAFIAVFREYIIATL